MQDKVALKASFGGSLVNHYLCFQYIAYLPLEEMLRLRRLSTAMK